ncbi:hypothetical protein BLOT_003610 [Blomia tropicalis]|nr:hypothetical protein BLOT_003610 [Blomia tropicalis]
MAIRLREDGFNRNELQTKKKIENLKAKYYKKKQIFQVIGVDMRFKYCPNCRRAGTCLRNCDINFGRPPGNMESIGTFGSIYTSLKISFLKCINFYYKSPITLCYVQFTN